MARHLNLIGFITGNLGLGVAARNIARAAVASGLSVSALDLEGGPYRRNSVREFEHIVVPKAADLPPGINLFVLPPASLASGLVDEPAFSELLSAPEALNAAYTFWELPTLPASWCKVLQLFDCVVAPTGFIENTLANTLDDTHVIRGLTPIDLPDGIESCRERFGIPQDGFVALSSFDPLSDPERKNPAAAVEAFERAFGAQDKARLVVKLNVPAAGYGREDLDRGVVAPLVERLKSNPRTIVIAESLPYRDLLSLTASVDAFISLHRAEGLGLGLLEAMGLGKPVVATGWSGNREFMAPSNSCMVKYRLTPASGTHKAYQEARKERHTFWADPDVDDAALWLRRLASDTDFRQRMGAAARDAFDHYRSRSGDLGFLSDLQELHTHLQADPRRKAAAQKLQQVQAMQRQIRFARLPARRRLFITAYEYFHRHVGWRLE